MALVYHEINSNKRKSALLVGVFLLIIIGLGWLFALGYNQPGILYIAVGFSVIYALISYYASSRVALVLSKAQEVRSNEEPELYRLVENLAITAGLPAPKLYLIDDTAPNAFATGRDPQHAAVAVTRGLLQKLNKQELEGVIAHEISHIGNYDIRLMTLVVVLVGVLTLFADFMLRFSLFGRGRRSEGGGQAQVLFLVAGLLLALLSPIIAMLIQLAISRKREFLADASAVLLTRYPEGLASALEKIASDHEPLEVANKATAHLYISDPLKNNKGSVRWFAKLFQTHPPVEERARKLRGML